MGLGGYTPTTFDSAAQTAFTIGTAAVLAVNESDVRIVNFSAYTPTVRRLLDAGVRVDVSVVAADAAAAQALNATLAVATATSALSTALVAAGLTHVSNLVFISSPVVLDLAPPPPLALNVSSDGAAAGVTAAASFLMPIVVAALLAGAAASA